jgi:hypothetical protein
MAKGGDTTEFDWSAANVVEADGPPLANGNADQTWRNVADPVLYRHLVGHDLKKAGHFSGTVLLYAVESDGVDTARC